MHSFSDIEALFGNAPRTLYTYSLETGKHKCKKEHKPPLYSTLYINLPLFFLSQSRVLAKDTIFGRIFSRELKKKTCLRLDLSENAFSQEGQL
jgi:hypothetical protein